jgi:hypothetical protein
MCSRVTCGSCKKYTWSGCGQHVEEALYGLSDSQICKCDATSAPSGGGFFSKLFGGK